jgi:hypothetical protein
MGVRFTWLPPRLTDLLDCRRYDVARRRFVSRKIENFSRWLLVVNGGWFVGSSLLAVRKLRNGLERKRYEAA